MKTEQIAKICHEANRAYCETLGDYSLAIWEESPEWQRESMVGGVEFRLANPVCRPEDIHRSWMVKKTETGWVYGEIKSATRKTHPCILPYDKLPEEQRFKDALFISIVDTLTRPFRIGTVEPCSISSDSAHTVGFVRGFIRKYGDSPVSREEIFGYLKTLIK